MKIILFLFIIQLFLACSSGKESETGSSLKKCTCVKQGISLVIKNKTKVEAEKECSKGVTPGEITKCE